MSADKSVVQFNLRLSSELKKTIEDAAVLTGQSVSEFATSTLVQTARKILNDQQVTRLSERDQRIFAAMLDDESCQPNDALVYAGKQYRKHIGR